MRVFFFLLLLLFLAAVTIFAWQNHDLTQINFLDQSIQLPMAAVIGAAYVLGMLSGWTVVGFIRSSLRRIEYRDKV